MLHFKFFLLIHLYISYSINQSAGTPFFPTNSAYGIFAALAVPLDLPNRNVFLSYNFEANYNMPFTWDIPPVAYGIEDEELYETGRKCTNCTANDESARMKISETEEGEKEDEEPTEQTTENQTTTEANQTESSEETTTTTTTTKRPKTKRKRIQRSLLTRTHFYHILMDKFKRSGYQAEPCLLRLICEINASELGDINGVLGNLIHIIFSPSTSMNENLPLSYYQAEIDGTHEQCEHYADECKENLLDFISQPLTDILQTMMQNK